MEIETFVIVCFFAWQSINDAGGEPVSGGLRIIGGREAAKGQAPYQCSVQYQYTHDCGCAILNHKWTVTTAFCIESRKPGEIAVLVGTNDLTEGGDRYQAEKLIKHSGFDIPSLANDIGLIRVEETIEFNRFALPIEYSAEEIQPGSILQFTGWGRLWHNGIVPIRLQAINLTAISYEQCKRTEKEVHTGHLCTLDPNGHGACDGDGGNPLTFNGKLVGINCFLVPCGEGRPDGFTKISYYHNWIRSTILHNPAN